MLLLLTPPLVEEELKLQLDIKADKGSEPTPRTVQRADLPFPCVFKCVARCHMNKADYDASTDAFIPAIHSTRCS